MDFSPCISDFRELSAAHPCVPQSAALVHSLNNSNVMHSRSQWPPVWSYMPCRSVHNCFWPLLTTQLHRAPCSPPFLFLGLLHLHAALAIGTQHASDRAGPIYDTSHPAEDVTHRKAYRLEIEVHSEIWRMLIAIGGAMIHKTRGNWRSVIVHEAKSIDCERETAVVKYSKSSLELFVDTRESLSTT